MDNINEKFNNMWQLLRTRYIEIDVVTNRDLLCIICNRILKNAYQNVCGCRYCFVCIESYWYFGRGAGKNCPGPSEDCNKGNDVDPMAGIQADHAANRKLAQLVVKCPEKDCHFQDELLNMFDHLKSEHIRKCPFIKLGCCPDICLTTKENCRNDFEKGNDNDNKHNLLWSCDQLATKESDAHHQLLVETILVMKKEIASLKSDLQITNQKSVEERNSIKERWNDQKKSIDNLRSELDKCRNESMSMASQFSTLSSSTEMLKREVETSNSEFMRKMKNRLAQDIEQIRKKQSTLNESIENKTKTDCVNRVKDLKSEINQKIEKVKIELINESTSIQEKNRSNVEKMITSAINKALSSSNEMNVKSDKRMKIRTEGNLEVNGVDEDRMNKEELKKRAAELEKIEQELKQYHAEIEKVMKEVKSIETDFKCRLDGLENEIRQSKRLSAIDNLNILGNSDCRELTKNLEKEDVRTVKQILQSLKVNNTLIMQRQEELAKEFCSILIQTIELKKEVTAIKLKRAELQELEKRSNNDSGSVGRPQSTYLQSSYDWRVEEFSKKFENARSGKEQYITSEWFKLAGYKLGFQLFPNGDGYFPGFLSVFGFIIKLDKETEQPPKFKVIISILDLARGQSHICREYDYSMIKEEFNESEWSQDTDKKPLGASDFCELDILTPGRGYVVRDCLVLRISIKH